ncbi:hypothetical protein JDV02_004765 [Purpureocillium takamizusanense]|uniref:Delta(24)-sterol reductase n=1 Tax=Purpureocillium takamizusanense TaxID=2060973 RepID=A0A9Q8VAB0_9HYPO|nr:uncharacterized protein JDV02_004765 [Purpureocillium takamizusanense]UNI18498.1 hypothetical protein JDV02_004765 [Purpureocillium takamizusanense]
MSGSDNSTSSSDGGAMMDAHNAAVARIAAQVQSFHAQQKAFRIYHGSTNSTRHSPRRADNTIDTSRLDRVLRVDTATRTALVEPNVPMDALVAATLPHGLVPPVVMELPGITVGGGFSGTSGESSSFRHGAFDATVRSIEMVTPDGTVARASKTERQDLFWGAASAFGTLGVVTLLEVELRPACRYVRLTYSLARGGAAETVRVMGEACAREDVDYVDGIAFNADETVVCVGRLTDEVHREEDGGTTKIRRFTRRHDPWFYIRARVVLETLRKKEKEQQKQQQQQSPPPETAVVVVDTIPLQDYLFRYDRGGFWVARYAFRYFLTPFNRATRFLLDRYMHARVMYRALHKSGLGDYYMVQDVGVPYDRAAEFQEWLDGALAIYPLWLCPLRVRREGGDSAAHGLHAEFADPARAADLMNFGVWGPLSSGGGTKATQRWGGGGIEHRRSVVRQNRALEQKVHELGGKKWLYAHAYYTEEEFWAHYDRGSYDALRERYGAGYLPSVYDKVRVDVDAEEAAVNATWRTRAKARVKGVWPLRGLYGFAAAAVGAEYLLQKGEKTKTTKKDTKTEAKRKEEKEGEKGNEEGKGHDGDINKVKAPTQATAGEGQRSEQEPVGEKKE